MYTDGACKGNPGKGGWGAYLIFGKYSKSLFGGEENTTNNRMELMAAIKGLEALHQSCDVDIFTDSQYVRKGITEWIANWRKNGWKTASKKPVKNTDLWQKLDTVQLQHQVCWHWVKGHNGDEGNEMADTLANKGVESLS